jgi:uncharacterized protein
MERANRRRVCSLIIAALFAACSCARTSNSKVDPAAEVGPGQVPVRISSVGFDESSQAHYVMLTSTDQEQQLPIMIGDGEAAAIMRAMQGVTPQRPLTNDLMKSIIETTGGRVDCISISDIHDEVYYATIYMNGGKARVDGRPSDAIALAASVGAPIFVAAKLFQTLPAPDLAGAIAPITATAMGITVEQLTPALAEYFHASKGVVVSQVSETAAKNGIERGDLILQVGARAISTPSDFERAAKTERGPTVVLRVSHDGAEHNISFEL